MARHWRPLALVAAVVAALALAQTSQGRSLLTRVGLREQPPAYTALSFTHPQSFPQQLSAPEVLQPVSFRIHNASAAAHTYHWSMVLVRPGRPDSVKAQGTVSIPPQQRAQVSKTLVLGCPRDWSRLEVRLPAMNESIYFLTSCWSPPLQQAKL